MWNPDKNEKSKEDRVKALFNKEQQEHYALQQEAKQERIAIQQEASQSTTPKAEKTDTIPTEARELIARFKREMFVKE